MDSRRQHVMGYYRRKDGWEARTFKEGERVPVPCAQTELSFEDVYIQTPYL